jgi:hypothetical protein
VVEVVLFNAGVQLPVIPLLEVVGNGDKLPPEQIGATGVKVGTVLLFTLIAKVVEDRALSGIGCKSISG